MTQPTRCLFCDHALDGRSKKFCTTCLPPYGEWDDKREYNKQYMILWCAAGGGTLGMERCKIPKTHGAYSAKPEIHGPPAPTPCECGHPIFGSAKRCAQCKLEQTELDRRHRLINEANRLFPPLPDDLRTRLRVFQAQPQPDDPDNFRRIYIRHPGGFPECALRPCEGCGIPARPYYQATIQTLCNRCRFIKKGKQRHVAEARRRAAASLGDEIEWRELGERDGWCCHICSGRVLKRAGTAHVPKGATVDHLVPIADGGSHTWDNVALAHRSCNTSRGAGGTAQLRLVG